MSSTYCFLIFGVKRLTIGTIISPPIIATAPQFIGFINFKKMLIMVNPTPNVKLAQTAAFVVFFQNNPYKNGERNAPARAPHEMPISCAINVGGFNAITTEIIIKNKTRIRIVSRVFLSSIFLKTDSFRTSSVSVELEVNTSEDNVDMEAESTSTTTIPIRISGNVESICGTILSYNNAPSRTPPL